MKTKFVNYALTGLIFFMGWWYPYPDPVADPEQGGGLAIERTQVELF